MVYYLCNLQQARLALQTRIVRLPSRSRCRGKTLRRIRIQSNYMNYITRIRPFYAMRGPHESAMFHHTSASWCATLVYIQYAEYATIHRRAKINAPQKTNIPHMAPIQLIIVLSQSLLKAQLKGSVITGFNFHFSNVGHLDNELSDSISSLQALSDLFR